MQGDRETKDSPAAVIGLLFFRQFLKSLGTSPSFLLSLVSCPLSHLSSIPPSSALSFNSLLSSVSLLCAKNIFIILLCCPHSVVPQHTNDSVCVCVCVCLCVRERLSDCVYSYVFAGVNACEYKSCVYTACACMCAFVYLIKNVCVCVCVCVCVVFYFRL